MLIGIDTSRAFELQPTGTENYSYCLISTLAAIDRKNKYRLYIKGDRKSLHPTPKTFNLVNWPKNFEFVKIGLPRLWTQLGLAAECLIHPPDILFIPAHTLPILRRPTLPTIVTIHDLGAEFLPTAHTIPAKFYLTFSTKYALRAATAIIAVSAATKKDLISKFGADPKKIFVVYEGINKEEFRIKNSELRIKQVLAKYKIKKPYILFVGTIQPRKNLVKLIEAFSLLVRSSWFTDKRQKLTTNNELRTTNLIIVGKKGWLYDEILAAPKKFGVQDSVRFLGYIKDSDLPYLYSQAEAFVLPSLVEGFGLPVLEAMAAKIPVVVSNRSSLPEVVGQAGLYFNPENVQEISATIFKVLTNPQLRKDLIEKGKKQVAKFSWEKTAKKTLEILERVYYED